jgi:hypothetical protein
MRAHAYLLADRSAQRSLEQLSEHAATASVSVIELAPLAVDIARATVAGFPSEPLPASIERIAGADGVIAATPVHKARRGQWAVQVVCRSPGQRPADRQAGSPGRRTMGR